ncbi:MAG: glycoside hydrolase family 16 protein [Fibrobacterales bacterium]|nr:glycoside hydrolase family 16 protein [Fibrobacterales bacterium]
MKRRLSALLFAAPLALLLAAGGLVACSDDSGSDSCPTCGGTLSDGGSSDSSPDLSSEGEGSSEGGASQPEESSETEGSSADDGASQPENSSEEESSSSSSSSSSLSSVVDGPQPVWADEFDGSAIDGSKWGFNIGTGSSGWGNNEWEYYTDRAENAYVRDGALHIRAQKESYGGSNYTSARMLTKGKFSFKYGTVKARIALPVGQGIWPAFWLLGDNIDDVGWPACGEIDIIETVNSENVVYGTNHWSDAGGNYATYGNNTGNFWAGAYQLDITQFHDYEFRWTAQSIKMFVDGHQYHEISIENNSGSTEEFHKNFFFILNVAVAGNWPGFTVDDAQFPNEMVVDYIRVYRD